MTCSQVIGGARRELVGASRDARLRPNDENNPACFEHTDDRRSIEPSPLRARADAQLLARYRDGDEAARREVVARFLPLVQKLARRYARGSEAHEDLVQVASLGLVKAIDRYDPGRGHAFSTFAVPTIVGELKRHFRDVGWAMHLPRVIQDRILEVNRATVELSRDLGRSPSPAELARKIGASTEEVLEAMDASRALRTLSLEAPLAGDANGTRGYADSVGALDARYEIVELIAALEPTIAAMPPRDRLVLRLRFNEDLTQSVIAERLGISQMQVSRIIRRAIARLRVTVGNAQDG